jgi:hypothetical protein
MSDVRGEIEGVVERRSGPDVHIGSVVLDAVGEAVGVPVAELDVELNDYVDPDALNDLFAPRLDGQARGSGSVRFEIAGCEVAIHDGRRVVVRPVE